MKESTVKMKEINAENTRPKKINVKLGLAAGLAVGAVVAACVKKHKKKSVAMNDIEDILASRTVILAAANTTEYAVTYNKDLDRGAPDDVNTGDAEVRFAKRMAEFLSKKTGAAFNAASTVLRDGTDASAVKEILIGNTGREESRFFRDSLALNEYGFEVKGNKVTVSGTNLATTERAVELFCEFVKRSVSRDADGALLALTNGFRVTEKADDWLVDIPEFEDGVRFGTHDADLGSLMIYYTDTTPEAFEKYCKKLERSGYKLWQRNDIEGNLHAGYEGKSGFIYVYYTACENSV